MNYQRIYDQIIVRARERQIDGYKEKHHIVPRCMNGSDKSSNIVELTAKEHFVCHRLLTKIHPDNTKLIHAFWMMCNTTSPDRRNYKVSGRTYQEGRELFSFTMSGDRNPNKKKENREKISKTMKIKGYRPPSPKGHKKNKQHRKNLSESLKGVKKSEDHKVKNSLSHIGLQIRDKNGMYKKVDKRNFMEDVRKGMKISDLYKKYSLNQTALYGRLEEFFDTKYIRQIRKQNL